MSDLLQLRGLGPAALATLKKFGISSVSQLADVTDTKIDEIVDGSRLSKKKMQNFMRAAQDANSKSGDKTDGVAEPPAKRARRSVRRSRGSLQELPPKRRSTRKTKEESTEKEASAEVKVTEEESVDPSTLPPLSLIKLDTMGSEEIFQECVRRGMPILEAKKLSASVKMQFLMQHCKENKDAVSTLSMLAESDKENLRDTLVLDPVETTEPTGLDIVRELYETVDGPSSMGASEFLDTVFGEVTLDESQKPYEIIDRTQLQLLNEAAKSVVKLALPKEFVEHVDVQQRQQHFMGRTGRPLLSDRSNRDDVTALIKSANMQRAAARDANAAAQLANDASHEWAVLLKNKSDTDLPRGIVSCMRSPDARELYFVSGCEFRDALVDELAEFINDDVSELVVSFTDAIDLTACVDDLAKETDIDGALQDVGRENDLELRQLVEAKMDGGDSARDNQAFNRLLAEMLKHETAHYFTVLVNVIALRRELESYNVHPKVHQWQMRQLGHACYNEQPACTSPDAKYHRVVPTLSGLSSTVLLHSDRAPVLPPTNRVMQLASPLNVIGGHFDQSVILVLECGSLVPKVGSRRHTCEAWRQLLLTQLQERVNCVTKVSDAALIAFLKAVLCTSAESRVELKNNFERHKSTLRRAALHGVDLNDITLKQSVSREQVHAVYALHQQGVSTEAILAFCGDPDNEAVGIADDKLKQAALLFLSWHEHVFWRRTRVLSPIIYACRTRHVPVHDATASQRKRIPTSLVEKEHVPLLRQSTTMAGSKLDLELAPALKQQVSENVAKLLKLKLYSYQSDTVKFLCDAEKRDIDMQVDELCLRPFNHGASLPKYDPETDDVSGRVEMPFLFEPLTDTLMATTSSQARHALSALSGAKVTMQGTLLCDEVGLGKTITVTSLVLSNPSSHLPLYQSKQEDRPHRCLQVRNGRILSGATLVIVPDTIGAQWRQEVASKTKLPLEQIVLLRTVHDLKGYSVQQLVDAEFVIVTRALLGGRSLATLVAGKKGNRLYETMPLPPLTAGEKKSKKKSLLSISAKSLGLPLEWFHWWRVVIDEAHEFFDPSTENDTVSSAAAHRACALTSTHRLVVTGTPFGDHVPHTLMWYSRFLRQRLQLKEGFTVLGNCNYNMELPPGDALITETIQKNELREQRSQAARKAAKSRGNRVYRRWRGAYNDAYRTSGGRDYLAPLRQFECVSGTLQFRRLMRTVCHAATRRTTRRDIGLLGEDDMPDVEAQVHFVSLTPHEQLLYDRVAESMPGSTLSLPKIGDININFFKDKTTTRKDVLAAASNPSKGYKCLADAFKNARDHAHWLLCAALMMRRLHRSRLRADRLTEAVDAWYDGEDLRRNDAELVAPNPNLPFAYNRDSLRNHDWVCRHAAISKDWRTDFGILSKEELKKLTLRVVGDVSATEVSDNDEEIKHDTESEVRQVDEADRVKYEDQMQRILKLLEAMNEGSSREHNRRVDLFEQQQQQQQRHNFWIRRSTRQHHMLQLPNWNFSCHRITRFPTTFGEFCRKFLSNRWINSVCYKHIADEIRSRARHDKLLEERIEELRDHVRRVDALGEAPVVPVAMSDDEHKEPHRYEIGPKLSTLLSVVKKRLEDPSARLVLFAAAESALRRVRSLLETAGVPCAALSGTAQKKARQLIAFVAEDEDEIPEWAPRVLLLSLKRSASGVNMFRATSVIFVDALDGSAQQVRTQETQAVARAVRQGGHHKENGEERLVECLRLVTKNTLEEVLYRRAMELEESENTAGASCAAEESAAASESESTSASSAASA